MSLPPEFIDELKKRFTGQIQNDLASRILYSTDASIYQIEPLGVAIPRTQEDLQAAVELAAKYRIPILPRGSGTSLAGQAIGPALILDCSRWLDSLVELDPESKTATVEPGLILSKLNLAAAKYGLMYGPDPASAERATMGGVIANNAAGAHSLTYGMTADHILSAEIIMADGSLGLLGERSTLANPLISRFYSASLEIREKHAETIPRHWPRAWRNSAGYRLNYLLPWSPTKPSQWDGDYPAHLKPGTLNLAHLLAGSEGTLAVIRRATVRLVERSTHSVLAVLTYQSNAEACDDVPRLLTHHPSAIELIPRFIIRQARSVPAYARQMGWVLGDPAALLVVEFSGDTPSALVEKARQAGEFLVIAETKEDQARIWNVRRVGLGLLDSRPQSDRPVAFIEDCAIPVDRLGEFVREVERILAEHGTEGGIYAHASAGCLHIRPILNLKTARGLRDLRTISEAVFALTVRLGGAMSSEHGDGLARSEFLERTYGPVLAEAMRSLKQAADPHNLLNPGKILDAPGMDMNLRYGEDYKPRVWNTNLSFARNGGLDVAIEQCNGQGLCRKDTGVMCPSYQATREEMHSTRGRANLLRALITHPLQIKNRKSEIENAVAQALDLCLACKGCKAECPSGVDMAKLKFAFQHEYYKTHRRKLRDYVFGYFHVAAGLAASIAPLANTMMEIPLVRSTVATLLGITNQRPFPKFVKNRSRFERGIHGGKKVIFLSDAFARYIEPETEQAALEILDCCEYDVHILPVIGAGASFLSKGFIDQARAYAGRVLDALEQIDPGRKAPVVGIEPPEVYCLKHDYPELLPERRAEIEQRTANVWLLDEYLLRSSKFHNLRIARKVEAAGLKTGNEITFHPHCHQRAEGLSEDGLPTGTNATLELLRSCGFDVELIDSGCCGMAGTFGYEAEHYDLSMKVGQLRLFPLLKTRSAFGTSPKSDIKSPNVNPTSPIGSRGGWQGVLSSGAACRLQIRQGTGLEAVHPILAVASRLKELSHAKE
ncbi:MAG TPA: FAD-linked oxidase C-terminal domain-containing protein [Anaerolineales bacterium]|nr:FAD-linked oxidase C-terminal domain-containing protein [Anaerolineales bacterium]